MGGWGGEREVPGWPALGAVPLAVVLWCKLAVCCVSESVAAEQCVCVSSHSSAALSLDGECEESGWHEAGQLHQLGLWARVGEGVCVGGGLGYPKSWSVPL